MSTSLSRKHNHNHIFLVVEECWCCSGFLDIFPPYLTPLHWMKSATKDNSSKKNCLSTLKANAKLFFLITLNLLCMLQLANIFDPCQQVFLSWTLPLTGVTLQRPLSSRAVEIRVWSVYQSSRKLNNS